MSKYLFIIESPGKIKKIKSFLGSDFKVMATVGHLMNLPPKKIGVNVKKDFEATFEVIEGKNPIVKEIVKEAKKSKIVYIATDIDREGELICKGIIDILPEHSNYKRVKYNSITKTEVLKGIENAGEVDDDLIKSAETRRILDRIVGWKVSFLTKQATGGVSAGRVQSATLRILAEREKEIQKFIPQEYWPIEAILETKKGERITALIKVPNKLKIKNKKQADKICETLKNEKILVSDYNVKEVSIKPYAPFTTSTLYQSGSSILGWPSNKTASIAQKEYELGNFTYIRTDSVFIVPEFINDIKSEIPIKYGSQYLPQKQNYYSNKKNAQEAHEAIRVIDIKNILNNKDDISKLYDIVWRRTIASQMSNMIQKRGSAEFQCEKYILSANGSKVIFDGFKKAWHYGETEDNELPELKIGEEMKLIDIKCEQKFTQPPPRYTEQSIIKEIEKRGIGRPSTYASIIKTLSDRLYIEKQKKTIITTEMGIRVSNFLIEADFCFVNLEFSSNLELDLDNIANKKSDKLEILKSFWNRLQSDIKNAIIVKDKQSETEEKCPECGSILLLKHSRFGPFLTCSKYKDKENKCDYKCNIDKDGKPQEKEVKEVNYSEEHKCKNCGEYLIIRINKKGGEYMSCRNWNKTDGCRGFFNMEGEKIVFKKKKFKKWKKKK